MMLQTGRFTAEQRAELERRMRREQPTMSMNREPPTAEETEAYFRRILSIQEERFDAAVRGGCCGK